MLTLALPFDILEPPPPPPPAAIALATNCVVAICVVFVPLAAVGAVGIPVNAGLAMLAFALTTDCTNAVVATCVLDVELAGLLFITRLPTTEIVLSVKFIELSATFELLVLVNVTFAPFKLTTLFPVLPAGATIVNCGPEPSVALTWNVAPCAVCPRLK